MTPLELYKPILGELKPATLSLGHIPLEDGAIQVGRFVPLEAPKTDLAVIVGEDSLRLSRKDSQKLQIDYNDERLEQHGRIRLLARPVGELMLRSSVTPEGIWRAEGEGLEVTDMASFDKFLTQVFLHIYRKQNPGASVADVLEIFDRYQEF